jgi:hypothetical protein
METDRDTDADIDTDKVMYTEQWKRIFRSDWSEVMQIILLLDPRCFEANILKRIEANILFYRVANRSEYLPNMTICFDSLDSEELKEANMGHPTERCLFD